MRYYHLNGRAGRKEYWLIVGVLVVVAVGLHLLHVKGGPIEIVLAFAQIRRFHDFNRSGWWVALGHGVPAAEMASVLALGGNSPAAQALAQGSGGVLGLIFMIWVGTVRGDTEANRFGPPPPSQYGDLWRPQSGLSATPE